MGGLRRHCRFPPGPDPSPQGCTEFSRHLANRIPFKQRSDGHPCPSRCRLGRSAGNRESIGGTLPGRGAKATMALNRMSPPIQPPNFRSILAWADEVSCRVRAKNYPSCSARFTPVDGSPVARSGVSAGAHLAFESATRKRVTTGIITGLGRICNYCVPTGSATCFRVPRFLSDPASP